MISCGTLSKNSFDTRFRITNFAKIWDMICPALTQSHCVSAL